mgnify:CR=1 FL=1
MFRKCHGIDIIESNLKQLSEKISEYKILNCTSNLEDIDAMEESADKYDRIVSFEVVEHVKNDFQTVRNMYTKLNVGGKIAISVPNKWWIFETHGAYLPILPWNRVPLFSWLPKFIHSRYAKARIYRKKDINKIVEHAGFKNITAVAYDDSQIDGFNDYCLDSKNDGSPYKGSGSLYVEAIK